MNKRNKLKPITHTILPTKYGEFTLYIFKKSVSNMENLVLIKGNIKNSKICIPVRVHSSCATGDIFGSLRCDCGKQLETAMKLITLNKEGIIIYLSQEGRGIGLTNKIKSYVLQDQGLDTVEANKKLGFAPDMRTYKKAIQILAYFNVTKVELMTNNPKKIQALEKVGITVKRHPLWVGRTKYNKKYLATKINKLKHLK